MIEITLTRDELEIGSAIGVRRQIDNLLAGRVHKYLAPYENGWEFHIHGALGEMAFAKWRNQYWNGNLGNFKAADVGRVQIRTTPYATGHLLLHPDDRDSDPFILVTCHAMPRFRLRGWLWAREGKLKEHWRVWKGNKRYAFWVPQPMLRPMTNGASGGARRASTV